MVIEFNPEQPAKACCPIIVIEFGKTMDTSVVQLMKA